MKKYLLILVSILTLASCASREEYNPQKSGKTGTLTLKVDAKESFITKASTVPPIADFTIVIKNADGSVWKKWDRYGEGITVTDIPEGNYTLEATYGENKNAAWESPYYLGSTGFSINAGESTEVAVTSALANSKVTITYADGLNTELRDIEVIATGKDGGVLIYTPDETRAGYFAVPDNKTVLIQVTGNRISNGEAVQQQVTITNFDVAQWHKVVVSLKKTAGSGNVSLTIDPTLIEKEQDIEIPESDDITGGKPDPDPTPEKTTSIIGSSYNGASFNIDQPLTVSAAAVKALDILISATDGIKNLKVTIVSPTIPQEDLVSMGLGGTFDMANPSEKTLTALLELGLLVEGESIAGKTSHTFSIGGFMSMLGSLPGGIGTAHQFEIEVIGTGGSTTKKALVINLVD